MTTKEILRKLEEIREQIIADVDNLTDYARYKSVCCIDGAIDYIKENEDGEW